MITAAIKTAPSGWEQRKRQAFLTDLVLLFVVAATKEMPLARSVIESLRGCHRNNYLMRLRWAADMGFVQLNKDNVRGRHPVYGTNRMVRLLIPIDQDIVRLAKVVSSVDCSPVPVDAHQDKQIPSRVSASLSERPSAAPPATPARTLHRPTTSQSRPTSTVHEYAARPPRTGLPRSFTLFGS